MSAPPPGYLQHEPKSEADGEEPDSFRAAVEGKKWGLRVAEVAKREYNAEKAGEVEIPDGTDLEDLLAEHDDEAAYRVDQLWPRHGHVILAAAYKSGKTTMIGNLARSLVDGDRFLGVYPVDRVVEGRVAIVDFEMPRNKLRQWYADQGIKNRRQVRVWTLRGTRSFNLLDDEVRRRWAIKLINAGTRVLILDCLAPALTALGLNESKNEEVGPFLDAVAALAVEAHIDEVLIVHHMGHVQERSRGASRLLDWPDVLWKLVRQKDDANPFAEADPTAPRFFSAIGRDVDVREGQLLFDAGSRRLLYAEGNRREARTNGSLVAALTYVVENPGASGRQIQSALMASGSSQVTARDTTKALLVDGWAVTVDGPKNSRLHTITPAGRAKLAALTAAPAGEDEPARVALSCRRCGALVPADMVDLGYEECAPCLDAGFDKAA